MDLITSSAELASACSRLAQYEFVTVDTEFMRESTYWPKLCVIQLACTDEIVLVDALASGLELGPFFALMADDRIVKVFHAARQDIEIVYHLSGITPHPVFDTQIAAMVCGYGDSIGYEQLVERMLGEQIDKSSRFTDWSQRPLTEKQITYACADVAHLRDVYVGLRGRLEEEGRGEWVSAEIDVLTSPDTYRMDPKEAWRRLKLRARRPMELAVTQEVAAWREREAQKRNVPRNRVLKDEAIYEIAAQQPTTAEALGKLRTVPRGFERSRSAEEILAAVGKALATPKDKLPRLPKTRRSGNGNGAAVDLLKVLLKMTSEAHGVASKVIASVDDLEAIAADDTADVPALKGWRRELFGETALRLKHGDVSLRLDGRRVTLIDQPQSVQQPR